MLAFGRASLRIAAHCRGLVAPSRPPLALRGLASGARDFKRNGNDFKKRSNQYERNKPSKFGHDYQYDTSGSDAPDDDLDIERIDTLISDRARARGDGRFDEADEIRDILLDDFGVVVNDRDKVWSTTNMNSNDQQQEQQMHHDYRLAVDAGPIQSPLGKREIENLIHKRLKCKLNRNFQDADVLLHKLRDANVSVHDKRREWRADGVFFDFQQKGYTQSTFSQETSPTNKAIIQELVVKRYEARGQQNFKRADQIRDELKNRFNVEVHDSLQTWSVGGDFGKLRGAGDRYAQSQKSKVTEYGAEIQKLVDHRNRHRKDRNFEVADQLRQKLHDEFGTIIDDDASEWIVRKKQRNHNRAAKFKRRGEGALTPEDEASIVLLVKTRSIAKYEKNFPKADQLLETLLKDFHVRVDDKKRQWMLASDQFIFAAEKSGSVDADTLALITQKIGERAAAKVKADYALADSISEELSIVYNVRTDDYTKEWWVEFDARPQVNKW
jgi:cysteinyl-tRNA synthetase